MEFEILQLDYRVPETRNILNLDELNAFYSTCFNAEYSQFLDTSAMGNVEKWTKTSVAEDLVAINHDDTKTLACFGNTKLIGTTVYAERQGYVYVWGMYVHPDNQRTGVGSALLKEVAQSVAEESRIEVSVVKQSVGALNFYKRHGFQTYKSELVEVFPNVELYVDFMQCTTFSIFKPKI